MQICESKPEWRPSYFASKTALASEGLKFSSVFWAGYLWEKFFGKRKGGEGWEFEHVSVVLLPILIRVAIQLFIEKIFSIFNMHIV